MSPEKQPNINSLGQEPKEKKRVVITSIDIKQQARDVAEEKLLASKAESKGFRGFWNRIWKQNLAHEYYRQREIAKAKREIKQSGNLYVGEGGEKADHENAMNAIVQRFASEYGDEMLRKGEERKSLKDENQEEKNLKNNIQDLIKRFAGGNISEEQFNLEKNNLFSSKIGGVRGSNGETYEEKDSLYADNLLEIAKQVKESIRHGQALDALDADLEIVIGKARTGVETEAQYNAVDKIVEKIKKNPGGKFLSRFVNEATLASAVAIVYGVGVKGAISGAQRAAKWVGPVGMGLSAGVGGAVAGFRENKRTKEERAQHEREMAKGGKQIENNSEKREEMEKYRYETKNAKELTDNLQGALTELKNKPSEEKMSNVLNQLNEISARITFAEQEKIDLVGFSNSKNVEQERMEMYVAAANANAFMRQNVGAVWSTFHNEKELNDFLLRNKEVKIQNTFLKEKTEKDRRFNEMKRGKVEAAVLKGFAIGLGAGVAMQEVLAYSGAHGLQEGLFNSPGSHTADQIHHYTALESLRRYIFNDAPRMDAAHLQEIAIGRSANVKLPQGLDFAKNTDGTFNIVQKGTQEAIVENIKFNSNGTLTEESRKMLQARGIFSQDILHHIEESKTNGAKDFVKNHEKLFSKVERGAWADNDTPKPDKNELKLWWGGEKGTGIDSKGNYVFNIKHMTRFGSFHGGKHWDPQALMKEGKIKMLISLSQDTQNQVVEIQFDANGNAVIDPNSEIGKIAFEKINGHAKFIGKFAEVAVMNDKTHHANVLATHVGAGVKNILTTADLHTTVLDVPSDYDYDAPYIIPIVPHKSLERLGEKKKEVAGGGSGQVAEKASAEGTSAIKIEEETDPVRAASMHTLHKLENYSDINAPTMSESDKKFLELTRKLWTELTIHGFTETNPLTGAVSIKKEGDLDGRSCLKLLELAGIAVDQNKVNYVTMGETAENGVIMDTSNTDGVIAKEKGKKLIMDHHADDSSRDTSATKFVYETLVGMGLLKRESYLDKYVDFVTKCDNQNFTDKEIKKVFQNYSHSLYGLRDKLKLEEILKFIQDGQDPSLPLPDDFIEKYKYLKNGKEESLKDYCKSFEGDIKISKKIIANMENEGFVVDTGDDRFGKILIDTKKKNNYPKVPNKSHMAQLASRVNGYGGYLVWAPQENSFVFYTNRKMDSTSIAGGFPAELDLKNVRGHMLLRKQGSVGPLKISLEELLSKLCGKKFKIEGKLSEAFIVDAKTKELEVLLDEKKLTEDVLRQTAKELNVPLRRILTVLLSQKNGLNKRFTDRIKGKKRESEIIDIAIEVLREHQENKNSNGQTNANNGNAAATSPAAPAQAQRSPLTISSAPPSKPTGAPAQTSQQTPPQMPPQQPLAPPQAPPQMPPQQPLTPPQMPGNLPDQKKDAISNSVRKMTELFSNSNLSQNVIKEEAAKNQIKPSELAVKFIEGVGNLKWQFKVRLNSLFFEGIKDDEAIEMVATLMILESERNKLQEIIRTKGEDDLLRLRLGEIIGSLKKLTREIYKKQDEIEKSQSVEEVFAKEVRDKYPEVFANLEEQMNEQKIPVQAQQNFFEVVAGANLSDSMVKKLASAEFIINIVQQSNFPDKIYGIRQGASGKIEVHIGRDKENDPTVKKTAGQLERTIIAL